MNIPYVFKRCTKCGEIKLATTEYFRKNKVGKFGLRANCKVCDKEYKKEWNKNNAEHKKEWNKEWYKNNAEYRKEYNKEWNKTPQGQVVAFNGRCRRRAKETALGNGITKEQWLECMQFFNWKCAYSGELLNKGNRSLDHIIPLNLGGANEIWNLVPMYINYNSSKNDKEMLEWYKEQPFCSEDRLKKIYEWQEYAYNKYYKEVVNCTI